MGETRRPRGIATGKLVLVAACLLVGAPALLSAQEDRRRAAPEQAQMMEQMAPMLQQMSVGAMNATLEVLSRPETAERMADFTRNFYEALLARRFSKVEALDIVKAVGIPSLGALR